MYVSMLAHLDRLRNSCRISPPSFPHVDLASHTTCNGVEDFEAQCLIRMVRLKCL